MGGMLANLARVGRGIVHAFRWRARVFFGVAALVLALCLFLPPTLLSVARKPFDYAAFNPWLPELPGYILRHDVSVARKLDFISNLALFWFSADSPFGGVDWGFAVTVSDLLRFLLLAMLLGFYFALFSYCRSGATRTRPGRRFAHGGGASGALASLLGISTGGCTVMGCGAPVLPVIGLMFVGLSSGTLAVLAGVSRVATMLVFTAVTLGILYLGWIAGEQRPSDRGGSASDVGATRKSSELG
jgi:hypothetical protein